MQKYRSYFSADTLQDSLKPGALKVTFFGTSTLLFDDGETQLLIDGFFSRPPLGKVAFGRLKTDKKLITQVISQYRINRLKGIFTCHSHYDHAMDAPEVALQTGARLFGSSSTLQIGKGYGLPDSLATLYKAGDTYNLGKFSVTVIASKHTPPFSILGRSNATDPNHPDITEPLKQPASVKKFIEGGTYDFYIRHGKHAVLVKASTNYIPEALKNYPADVFFLGAAMLGVMEDDFQRTYYNETVKTTGAHIVVPIHWDNFTKPFSKPLVALPYMGDNVEKGLNFLLSQTAQDGVQLKLMNGGQSIYLPDE